MNFFKQELSGLIELDGNRFIGCTFRNATLIYRGGAAPILSGCSFDPAQIQFKDAAANTVNLLTAMAQRESGLRYMVARMAWQILGNDGPASRDASASYTADAN
ncbi:hypothetical protein [Rhizorhapis sp.]|uniref:hypothetical protein n=1 Tax=Rhizorhapis sp. TaxID=1968842 RepID=UPI002B48F6A2|nr:hypothetical protein [Rhizorhapis sp.]HKR15759.1 hypothetical protein [Rhizorhapis sp.]